MKKPLIGITSGTMNNAQPYADAIERSGGEALVILPEHGPPPEETLARVGGLLLCGGEDIHPRWYGQEPLPQVHYVSDEARDEMELSLLRAALDADMPVLGIGRGMHALNVVLGGSIDPQIQGHAAHEKDGEEASSYHHIYITPGSKLSAVVGAGGFVRVNSRHRQGIREPQKSPLLLASAYSLEDGCIEALESPAHRWAIAVQFHPERRRENPPHFLRLFQSFVERAAERLNLA